MKSTLEILPLNSWLETNGKPVIIAGPCSAETAEQVMETAAQIKAEGFANVMRAGVWKPRTRPGSFEGVGEPALAWLKEAKQETGLPLAVEVATPEHIELSLKYGVDILWIGARTTVNPFNVQQLADALMTAMLDIKQCKRCRGLSDDDICPVCTDPRRNDSVLCIVETAADMMAIEQTANFNGKYFVLGGHLSPIDGIGAEQLGIGQLLRLLQQQAQDGEPIQEIILATSTTVEGQTTAHFISEAVKPYVSMITRIAQGIPMGGELEYLDAMTLGQALQNRGRL